MKMFTTRAQSLYIHAVYLTHHSDYPDLHYVHFGSSHFILSNHFQTKIFELFYCSFEAKCLEEGEYYALKFIPPLRLSIYLSLSLNIENQLLQLQYVLCFKNVISLKGAICHF